MRRILRLAPVLLTVGALALTACKEGGGKKSARARWVDNPKSGSTADKIVKIPGLGISFEQPDVLYVYKECGEAHHKPESSENDWIPVIRCQSVFNAESSDGEDAWSEGSDSDAEGVALTIYVTHKDAVINERAVETFRAAFQNQGFKVEDISYHEEYLAKPRRRGLEAKVQIIDTSSGYPSTEVLRFMFPVEDVVFIAQIDYPFGDDRSGMMSDWQRILWNFQLDEDGPLHPNAPVEEDSE
jgi:hypothetical protein